MNSNLSIIPPMKPLQGSRWTCMGQTGTRVTADYEGYYWLHEEGYVAISSVEVVEGGYDDKHIPHYHLSISKGPNRRCSSKDALFICAQFGMQDSMEDNHVPDGFVRNFWMPVAEDQRGIVCPCNDSEPAIRLDKGDFVWRGLG